MKQGRYIKYFPLALFLLYLIFVLWITLIGREFGERRLMLTPFWEYAKVINNDRRSYFIGQIIGNVLLLMPLGFLIFFLPKQHDIKLKKILLGAMFFSIFIELTQFITGRGLMEFDDIFNNTVGAVLGYGVYVIIKRFLPRKL